MSKTTLKVKPVTISGDAAFNAALDQWAQKQLEVEAKAAALEAALAKIREPEEAKLAVMRAEVAALAAAAEEYAFTHRDRLLPPDRKTAETALAEWSLRLDPPSVKQAGKSWPAARSVEALSEAGETLMLTVKTTLNKEAIHAEHGEDKEWLKRFGLAVVQDERFHLSVKRAVTSTGELS